jgi:Zn-dependent peptidase ImmA (M78 family)
MTRTPLTDIENLAESIGELYLVDGKVDLDKIIKDKNIFIIHEDYNDYFLGQLVHEQGDFFIYVNSNKLPDINAPRARFTIAHDCGHYFIDNHRNELKKGISLSNRTDNPAAIKPRHEIEADHFASNLLMPKDIFIEEAKKFEPVMESVLHLKEHFQTSLECTAIHYTKLDIVPCLMIRWRPHSSDQYAVRSKTLGQMTGISERPNIKINLPYIQSLMDEIQYSVPRIEFTEKVTYLSNWVASIAPQSPKDLTCLEQTYKLGNYGAITFLIA